MKNQIKCVLAIFSIMSLSFSAFAADQIKSEEKCALENLEKQSPKLLTLKAAGDDCTTSCHQNNYYPYDTVCNTSCSNSSSGSSYSGGPGCPGGNAVKGCLVGLLIGSLGDGAAMAGGCVGLGALFFAVTPKCD